MHLYIQWALSEPADLEVLDIRSTSDWAKVPGRAAPTDARVPLDGQRGWITAILCQGIQFTGYDWYAVSVASSGALCITGWQDSHDYRPGTRWATQWMLWEPVQTPATRLGWNTKQKRRTYAEAGAGIGAVTDPWSAFRRPPAELVRAGKWLPLELLYENAKLWGCGWKEWVG